MKPVVLATTLSLTASTVWASGNVLAKKAPSLQPRLTFQGGWPIAANTCPTNTTSCADTGFCCPNNTDCYTAGLGGDAACCPNTSDCSSTATAIPVCADSSWTLYIGNYNYFCCSAGQIGILPNPADSVAAGLCVESGSPVSSSVLATVYGAGAAATGTATQGDVVSTAVVGPSGTTVGGIITGTGSNATPTPSSTATGNTGKKNDSTKHSSSMSIIGMIIGFVLMPFGM